MTPIFHMKCAYNSFQLSVNVILVINLTNTFLTGGQPSPLESPLNPTDLSHKLGVNEVGHKKLEYFEDQAFERGL